jgi:hypothetical protein
VCACACAYVCVCVCHLNTDSDGVDGRGVTIVYPIIPQEVKEHSAVRT